MAGQAEFNYDPVTGPGERVLQGQPNPAPEPTPNWPSFSDATAALNQGRQPQPQPAPRYEPPQDPTAPPPAPPGYTFQDNLEIAGATGNATPNVPYGQPPIEAAATPPAAPGEQEPHPVSPGTSIRDQFAARGFPVAHYTSDDELLRDFGNITQENRRLQQLAQLGRRAMAEQQEPEAPEPKPEEPKSKLAQAPEWNDDWLSLITLDQKSNRYVAIDPEHVNPVVVDKANQHLAWQQRVSRALTRSNPTEALLNEFGLEEVLKEREKEVEDRVIARLQQEQAARQSASQVESYFNEHGKDLIQHDQAGQPIVNPVTNEYVLTQKGQSFQQHAASYQAQFQRTYGHAPSESDTLQVVLAQLEKEEMAQRLASQAPPSNPGQVNPQANTETFVQDAIRKQQVNAAKWTPNEGNSVTRGAALDQPLNGRPNFKQMIRREMQDRGVTIPPGYA